MHPLRPAPTCRPLARPLARLVAGAIVLLAASGTIGQAQGTLLEAAPASVALRATVPASLQIASTVVVGLDTAGEYATQLARVSVDGNVSHRVVAVAPHDVVVEVRRRGGEWMAVPSAGELTVAETDANQDTTHLVACRVRAGVAHASRPGCGLRFDLVSTDPEFPGRAAPRGVRIAAR